MGNKCKRFLVLLLAVLMVSSLGIVAVAQESAPDKEAVCYDHGDVNGDGAISDQDAIYVLYSTFPMFKDAYPIDQDVDLNKDTRVDTADAIYLLYAVYHMTGYELAGTVHAYFEPVWTWTETDEGMHASVAFRCGCGAEHDPLEAEVSCQNKEATCVAAGYRKYTAVVKQDGETYTAEKVIELSAGSTGHVIGAPTCTESAKCANCDYTLSALGHKFVLESTTPATCQAAAVETWKCACGEVQTITQEATLDHTYKYVENGDVLYSTLELSLEGAEHTACLWVKQYTCADCGKAKDVVLADTYHKHTYSGALTTEATCVSAGVKTYTCADCGDSYTDSVAINPDAHNWNAGTTENGVTTHTCTYNAAHTKTSVAMTDSGLTAEALAGSEVVLDQGTTVSLDAAAVEGLEADKSVVISVAPADVSGILTQDQKDQIAGNTVYDFTMNYDDGSAVSNFAGAVTVSLPYTLKDGDDIDSIDVWFIDNSGNLTQMKGTYANGFVTFTTTHFSYYTVTRLTPAERCARYGHIAVNSEKAATCLEDGYSMSVCHRCGQQLEKTVYAAPGHNYVRTGGAVTCDQDGPYTDVCSVCNHTVTGVVPALGHELELVEERSTAATCAGVGQNVYVCTKEGCDHEKVEELAQLAHSYETVETPADCTTNGYKERTCTVCGTKEVLEATAAFGHGYSAETAQWNWNDSYTAATVTLVCAHNEAHTETLTAVITKSTEAASCTGGGSVTYTARASLNKVTYTDSKTVTLDVVAHQPGQEWVSNATEHYHQCALCQVQMDNAAHEWDEGTVVKAATCNASGSMVYTCEICGYEKSVTLAATGKHNYYYGYCTVCGHIQTACTHVRLYRTELNLTGYNLCEGAKIEKLACQCGAYGYVSMETSCDFEVTMETVLDAWGEEQDVYINTCKNCGLTYKQYSLFEMIGDQCVGTAYMYESISVNGKAILDTKYDMDQFVGCKREHPEVIKKGSVAIEGMCNAEANILVCPCGEEETAWVDTDCEFTFISNENDTYTAICETCGTTVVETWSYDTKTNPCYDLETGTSSYYRNDQLLYTYSAQNAWPSHNYKVTSYTLVGKTCEDGVHMYLTCVDCGKQDERFAEYHYNANRTIIDVSDKGTCFETLVQSSCLCSLKVQNSWEEGENYCDWNEVSYDAKTETRVYACSVCGATRTVVATVGKKDANCYVKTLRTITYKNAAGTLLGTLYDSNTMMDHNYEAQLKLLGTTCRDGVEVTFVCVDCGHRGHSYVEYDHIGKLVDAYDLSEYGLCGGTFNIRKCLCGDNTWYEVENEQCNWNYIETEDGTDTRKCYQCGVIRTYTRTKLYDINACSSYRRITYKYSKDDQHLKTITFDQVTYNHNSIYELELEEGATSCEDGKVTVHQTCLTCGYTDTWTNENDDHNRYVVSRETIHHDAICSDLELVTNSCACGAEIYQWLDWVEEDSWCDMPWYGWDEETDEEIYKCMNCGLEERTKWSQTPVEGETCQMMQYRESNYVINGTVIATCVEQWINENHDMESTFEMLGDTCDDGYYVNWNCTKCGDSGRWGVEYGCEHYTITQKTYHDGTGICGPIVWEEYGCPCGNYREGNLRHWSCDWTWVNGDEKLGDTYRCVNCGMTRTGFQNEERIDGTCQVNVTYYYTYSLNGEELFTIDRNFTRTSHQTIATFEMLGTTCEDGYYVTRKCVGCDYVEDYKEPWFHHETHRTTYYDLADYGLCGGWFEVYSCPCGQEGHSNWDFECSFSSTNKNDPDTGLRIRRCSKCGAEGYYGNVGEVDPDTCTYEGTFYAKFAMNGETVLDVAGPIRWESHEMYAVEMSLKNPTGTCEDGWTVTMQCVNCDETGRRSGYDHERFEVSYLDLAEAGACGGFYQQRTCACGERASVNWDYSCESMSYDSWSEMDENYITHYYVERVCEDCGLTILENEWSVYEGDSCYGIYNEELQLSLNGTDLGTFYRKSETERHDRQIVAIELRPGATTCEDGVTVYRQCRNCDYTDSYNTTGHEYLAVESIDLAPYGSVCGGELNLYRCACGKYQRYDFDEETLCDLDRKYISHWIDGVIDTSQYTSLGYVGTWSYSYTFICAVTDPVQCGLKIRMSEYWLNEGCMAVEYQTWQLGYDDATGTCQQEITIATGDKHAYHPYTSESISETYDDGSYMNGTLYTCPDCGSTYSNKGYYAEDGDFVKRERHAENALYTVNGENQSYHYVDVYDLEYSGYRYNTLERWEYVGAKGDLRWEQYAWEYDFTKGCYGIRTNTYSNGDYDSYEFNAHNTTYETVTDKEPTCTQHGQRTRTWTCRVCQQITDVDTWETEPRAHYWEWNSDLGTHVCYYCELESINGASGSIVLEDFTDAYGNGTDYVIGYWNRGEVEFLCSVSVILDDVAEDQDNELYLTDIQFSYLKDDIIAVSCSKAAVQAAADAALANAGYTGSYAIRISCVPVHGEDTLDYAITFDSQLAE